MDINKARQVLGISEHATIEELENRFFILIKREKTSRLNTQENSDKELIDLDELTMAYETVKKDIIGESAEENTTNKNQTIEKMDHFFRYYKFHVLAGIIAIIVIASIITTVLENQSAKRIEASLPPSALQAVLLGEYYDVNLTPLKESLTAVVPEWERIKLEFLYAPQDSADYSYTVKNVAEFSRLKPDMLIVDRYQFELYAKQGMFLPLEEIAIGQNIASEQLLYAKTEDDPEEHLYGIDISNHRIFNGINLDGEKIAVISEGSEKQDNAVTLIKELVK
ncbi:hypothetical protein [Radiobacillus sp. PE A8.2]|uniref:hypothetical protein n=1 Tax=Radiobacillus sp. PE A8.2 TaxID=3380349 RepID=UPI003890D5B1